MLKAAAEETPARAWLKGDIAAWAGDPGSGLYDVVFSNAALQWLPDHGVLFPKLLARVSGGGALAAQVPAYNSPAHRLLREMTGTGPGAWYTHAIEFYYDTLAPNAGRLDLWETEYQHIMQDHAEIVEWYKGTALRPFLSALPAGEPRERFLMEYQRGLESVYPRRPDGRVLFPFRRIFLIAYR
jgi:trans-aconitate 2-methyltransferase